MTDTIASPTFSPELPGSAPLAQRIASRATGSPWFWAVFVLLGFAFPIVRSLNRELPKAPPVIGPLPAFSLVDAQGRTFDSARIGGQVVIAELVAPAAAGGVGAVSPLASLQRRVRNAGDAVHLVSFIAGPADAASVAALSHAAHAGVWRWTFAGGDTTEFAERLERLCGTVSGRLILIDARGRVRRVVGTSPEEIDLMMRDIGVLVNLEGRR